MSPRIDQATTIDSTSISNKEIDLQESKEKINKKQSVESEHKEAIQQTNENDYIEVNFEDTKEIGGYSSKKTTSSYWSKKTEQVGDIITAPIKTNYATLPYEEYTPTLINAFGGIYQFTINDIKIQTLSDTPIKITKTEDGEIVIQGNIEKIECDKDTKITLYKSNVDYFVSKGQSNIKVINSTLNSLTSGDKNDTIQILNNSVINGIYTHEGNDKIVVENSEIRNKINTGSGTNRVELSNSNVEGIEVKEGGKVTTKNNNNSTIGSSINTNRIDERLLEVGPLKVPEGFELVSQDVTRKTVIEKNKADEKNGCYNLYKYDDDINPEDEEALINYDISREAFMEICSFLDELNRSDYTDNFTGIYQSDDMLKGTIKQFGFQSLADIAILFQEYNIRNTEDLDKAREELGLHNIKDNKEKQEHPINKAACFLDVLTANQTDKDNLKAFWGKIEYEARMLKYYDFEHEVYNSPNGERLKQAMENMSEQGSVRALQTIHMFFQKAIQSNGIEIVGNVQNFYEQYGINEQYIKNLINNAEKNKDKWMERLTATTVDSTYRNEFGNLITVCEKYDAYGNLICRNEFNESTGIVTQVDTYYNFNRDLNDKNNSKLSAWTETEWTISKISTDANDNTKTEFSHAFMEEYLLKDNGETDVAGNQLVYLAPEQVKIVLSNMLEQFTFIENTTNIQKDKGWQCWALDPMLATVTSIFNANYEKVEIQHYLKLAFPGLVQIDGSLNINGVDYNNINFKVLDILHRKITRKMYINVDDDYMNDLDENLNIIIPETDLSSTIPALNQSLTAIDDIFELSDSKLEEQLIQEIQQRKNNGETNINKDKIREELRTKMQKEHEAVALSNFQEIYDGLQRQIDLKINEFDETFDTEGGIARIYTIFEDKMIQPGTSHEKVRAMLLAWKEEAKHILPTDDDGNLKLTVDDIKNYKTKLLAIYKTLTGTDFTKDNFEKTLGICHILNSMDDSPELVLKLGHDFECNEDMLSKESKDIYKLYETQIENDAGEIKEIKLDKDFQKIAAGVGFSFNDYTDMVKSRGNKTDEEYKNLQDQIYEAAKGTAMFNMLNKKYSGDKDKITDEIVNFTIDIDKVRKEAEEIITSSDLTSINNSKTTENSHDYIERAQIAKNIYITAATSIATGCTGGWAAIPVGIAVSYWLNGINELSTKDGFTAGEQISAIADGLISGILSGPAKNITETQLFQCDFMQDHKFLSTYLKNVFINNIKMTGKDAIFLPIQQMVKNWHDSNGENWQITDEQWDEIKTQIGYDALCAFSLALVETGLEEAAEFTKEKMGINKVKEDATKLRENIKTTCEKKNDKTLNELLTKLDKRLDDTSVQQKNLKEIIRILQKGDNLSDVDAIKLELFFEREDASKYFTDTLNTLRGKGAGDESIADAINTLTSTDAFSDISKWEQTLKKVKIITVNASASMGKTGGSSIAKSNINNSIYNIYGKEMYAIDWNDITEDNKEKYMKSLAENPLKFLYTK